MYFFTLASTWTKIDNASCGLSLFMPLIILEMMKMERNHFRLLIKLEFHLLRGIVQWAKSADIMEERTETTTRSMQEYLFAKL